MTAQPKLATEAEATGPFVVNLCSSTTPMALAQPKTEELKRFNFFVSRRRADGRDRFHLHMGHFMTLTEAEEWVAVVRDIYPGAWAGEAPGKKLAQRAAASLAPNVPVAPAVAVVPSPPPAAAPAQPAAPVAEQPVLTLAPEMPASAPPVVVPTLRAVPEAGPAPVVATTSVPVAQAPLAEPVQAAAPAARSVPPVTAATPAAPAVSQKLKAAPTAAKKPLPPGSNVREVLKSLDDTAPTRNMPASVIEPPSLSDTAVLRILEDRRSDGRSKGGEQAARGIEMLRPDDTATVRALKDAVRDNAPVSFAVQLQWSVAPIDLASVPPLAIFSAYTLYTVEGSRDGRKWYGLRLGFFTDAISAKQVASYVRSEFTSVAVIPVTTQERSRATDGDPKAAAAAAARPRKEAERKTEEFKLIDDVTDDIVSPSLLAAQAQMKPSAGKPAPVAGAKKKPLGKVRASEKRSAKSLEETLEILGASDLEIDNGRGELLNDSGVRHIRVEQVAPKNSPFSKLLDRLTERVKKRA